MDVASAIVMRDSFARTAAEELAEERFPAAEREKILALFKDTLVKAQEDLERHLPRTDPHDGPRILTKMLRHRAVPRARRDPRRDHR